MMRLIIYFIIFNISLLSPQFSHSSHDKQLSYFNDISQNYIHEPHLNKRHSSKSHKGDYVVILHGLLTTHRAMDLYEKAFSDAGFNVININYPTTKYDMDFLAKNYILPSIRHHYRNKSKKIHFVGYSMGGIMTRYIIENWRPKKLGRVVMVGSANQGSELAENVTSYQIANKLLGPALADIARNSHFMKNLNTQANYEVGIIAGLKDHKFVKFPTSILSDQSDGVVTIDSTKLKGSKDHIVISSSHRDLKRNQEAIKNSVHFIKNGRFIAK